MKVHIQKQWACQQHRFAQQQQNVTNEITVTIDDHLS